MAGLSLHTAPAQEIDEAALRQFCRQQAEDRLFLESTTLELKRDLTHKAVDAIGALANGDGGIVLIGVDENDPDAIPGVRKRDHDRLVNMCAETIEPRFVPEIVVIPLAAPDSVVLLARVNLEDVPGRPVLVRGVAYLRSPGRSHRALRDELLRLCAAPDASPFVTGPGASTLAADYQPDRAPAEDRLPARLRLVAASAAWLRPRQRSGLALGTTLRRSLKSAVERSPAARYAAGPHTDDRPLQWQVLRSNENRLAVYAQVPRRFEPLRVALSLDVRLDGSRLAFGVGVHVGDPDRPESSPVMSAEDAVHGLMLLIELVRAGMLDAVEEHFREPVLARHAAHAWLWPDNGSLAAAVGLDCWPRDADNAIRALDLLIDGPSPSHDERSLLEGLARSLMADGFQDPEDAAARLVDAAKARQPGQPWL
jgi:hypothetical protein